MKNRLNSEQWQRLASYLKEKRLPRGEKLFVPDDSADGVYFVRSGRLGVQTGTGFEDRLQVVALIEEGSPIGEKGLTMNETRGMSVVAIEDAVLDHLSGEDFAEIEQSHPQLAIALLKALLDITSLRLQASSERLAHVL